MRILLCAAHFAQSTQCWIRYWCITVHPGSIWQHFSQSFSKCWGKLSTECWLMQIQTWWKQTCQQHKQRHLTKNKEMQKLTKVQNGTICKLFVESLFYPLNITKSSSCKSTEQATKHGTEPRNPYIRKHGGASAGPGIAWLFAEQWEQAPSYRTILTWTARFWGRCPLPTLHSRRGADWLRSYLQWSSNGRSNSWS